MTIIKIPIPKTQNLIEIVVAVDVYDMEGGDKDESDNASLGLERIIGKYVGEMLKNIGVKGMEIIQD